MSSTAPEQQAPGEVLVVDDNPANLRLMVSVLREGGYAVRVAPSGRLALDSVQARPPDLILLDIRMPDLDGYEVCRRLKADPARHDIPVIFLSALCEPADKVRGFAVGAVDYITKPFVAEEVLVRVQSHLALHASQQRLEALVAERTRALRTLSAGNQALVHADGLDDLLANMHEALVRKGGYARALIMLIGGPCYPPIAEAEDVAVPDAPCLGLPVPVSSERGGRTLLLPLRDARGDLGCLQVESRRPAPFADPDEVARLMELAGDLAYGVRSQQDRAESQRAQQALEQSLERTIEAIAATIEVRDPYTAGHQQRTTEIAEVIAEELGLDDARRKGLHVAGAIHDIGKVAIPVEILSRPGRLSDLEFEMIKTHPAVGYEIIKGIEFPWPVAEIIRQHHERLDGSGYPDGLRGEAILLEARILAVADVVEAISSHRPYRPALGLAAALDELRAKRGTLYDPEVVDACLRLAAQGCLPVESR
ncbi:HD domain-containing phosphohydrolase [Alkalilimnicola ehrlichii]|uniref:HD domain-containing phosphohydrolase n=1 Tax=Alkalilimnicola ehrlichii TaxID=351052 RepID=UPI003B9F68A5